MIHFQTGAKVCGSAAIAFIAFIALCPADWVLRTDLGFELDHFLAFFLVTSLVCVAWPRPFLVGAILIVFGALLEALQLLTPDRSANVLGAFYSALGALAAAVLAELVIRGQRWAASKNEGA